MMLWGGPTSNPLSHKDYNLISLMAGHRTANFKRQSGLLLLMYLSELLSFSLPHFSHLPHGAITNNIYVKSVMRISPHNIYEAIFKKSYNIKISRDTLNC